MKVNTNHLLASREERFGGFFLSYIQLEYIENFLF